MKKILLTGGSGFLGSKITEIFLSNGYSVLVLLRKNSYLKRLEKVISNPNLYQVFIEDGLEKCFLDHQIDYIIHTATCYGRNNENWTEIAEANLILPLQLLIAAEKYNVKCFLNTDTFFNENIVFEKKENLYVQTKKEFLKFAKYIIKNTTFKFFNLKVEQMYGPDDNPQKFIPFIINELLSQKSSIPLTFGEQKRDLVFVDDVASAFLHVVKKEDDLEKYEEFGIGSGESISLKKIIEFIKNTTKSNSILNFGELNYRDGEIMNSVADLSNNIKIDWKTSIEWQESVKKTVDFYIENKKYE